MGKRQSSKGNADGDKYGAIVWHYVEKLQKYNAIKAKFSAIKDEFDAAMDQMFGERSSRSVTVTNHNLTDGESNVVKVTKVERTTIRWDIDKLKKRLPRDVVAKVVRKDYRIKDMRELSRYLKSCGVDPEIFKHYIEINESVDQTAIDEMGKLGYVSAQQVSGCYIVECAKPYYKVAMVKQKQEEHE